MHRKRKPVLAKQAQVQQTQVLRRLLNLNITDEMIIKIHFSAGAAERFETACSDD